MAASASKAAAKFFRCWLAGFDWLCEKTLLARPGRTATLYHCFSVDRYDRRAQISRDIS
jgi:hypothetical protein